MEIDRNKRHFKDSNEDDSRSENEGYVGKTQE